MTGPSGQKTCDAWISMGNRWGNRESPTLFYYDCSMKDGHDGPHHADVTVFPGARVDRASDKAVLSWSV